MWQWATATQAAGIDVAVVYDADLQGDSPLRSVAVPIVPLTHTGTGRLRVPRRLSAVLTKDDIVILHSTYIPSNVAAAWSARRHDVPYVVVPHGGYDARSRARRSRRKRLWLPVERAYLERALAVHVFFETEAPDAARIAGNARWIIAPTGSDLPTASWDGGTGGYLAWLGRYDIRHKGLDILIQAMARLSRRDRRLLRLHGRPSENTPQDVERLAVDGGIADLVTVGGPVTGSEKADFLRRASAYVHPSRWESLSLALMEALNSGVPSVVSASCSVAPKLRAADAAVVVEATPDAIAQGIRAILCNPQHYSDRARQFVRTSLAWPAIIRDYVDQIEHLRSGKSGHAAQSR
jgi:glycosyltransferase involved in cell wall biosynthesis